MAEHPVGFRKRYLLRTPWGSVRLHRWTGEGSEKPHDHRWSFVSIPLVDPEEAAQRQKIVERLKQALAHGEAIVAQRDALLPVVEAARAYEAAWTAWKDMTSRSEDYVRATLAKAETHQRLLDFTRALDSGTREESTDGR